jgi:peptide/nickel transport system permease protein
LAEPARQFCGGSQATPRCIEWARTEFHLDAPLPERYARFLWRLVADQSAGPAPYTGPYPGPIATLDSGQLARQAVPPTLSLVVPALLLAAGVGVLAGGALARVRWRRVFDLPIYVAVGLMPAFLALWLSFFIAFKWELAPLGGYCDFFNPPPGRPEEGPACGGAVDWATHLVLPVITLSLYFAAVYTRVVRALVVRDRLERDPEKRRKRRRGSSFLFARSVGRDFGFAIGVGVFVELVFQIPGLGWSTVTSVQRSSLLETQACVLYATFLAISVHFVVDVAVGALDSGLRWERPVARKPKPA